MFIAVSVFFVEIKGLLSRRDETFDWKYGSAFPLLLWCLVKWKWKTFTDSTGWWCVDQFLIEEASEQQNVREKCDRTSLMLRREGGKRRLVPGATATLNTVHWDTRDGQTATWTVTVVTGCQPVSDLQILVMRNRFVLTYHLSGVKGDARYTNDG